MLMERSLSSRRDQLPDKGKDWRCRPFELLLVHARHINNLPGRNTGLLTESNARASPLQILECRLLRGRLATTSPRQLTPLS